MAQDSKDFFTGYIKEVQSYIPIIRNGIVNLRTDPGNSEALDEVYRLVHIIKGASAMVGVDGLSQIAAIMESALEHVQEETLNLSPELLAAMEQTVGRVERYCLGLRQETVVDEQEMLAATKTDFARLGQAANLEPAGQGNSWASAGELLSAGMELAPGDQESAGMIKAEVEKQFEALNLAMQFLEHKIAAPMPMTTELREVAGSLGDTLQAVRAAAEQGEQHGIAALSQLIADVAVWLQYSAVSMDPGWVELLSEALDALTTMVYIPADFDEQRAEAVLAKLNGRMEEKVTPVSETAVGNTMSQASPMAAVETNAAKPAGTGSLQGALFSDEEKQLLLEGFREEAEEHLQELHEAMQHFEKKIESEVALTTAHRDEIRRIRRAVHTIKGASAVIGLSEIAAYAHGVEDFLDWLYEGAKTIDPVVVNGMGESLDLLGLLIESPLKASPERQAASIKRLEGFTLGGSALPSALVPEQPAASPAEAVPQPEPEIAKEKEEEGALSQQLGAESSKTIRINQQQLDSLINLSNELLVGVSGFDQNMELFKGALGELELTASRLKAIALELETKFEVKALDQLSQHFAHLDQAVAQIKTSQSFSEFDALELDRYTQLNLIIRSLNESAIDVTAIHTNLGGIYSGIGGDINRQHRVIREMQVQMLKTRMIPMSTLTSRLSRTMRDVATRLGRPARLVVEGERVELDRVVWEKLADPLMHLVRNAIHHGVEPPEERKAHNKPAIATITLIGRREGNSIVIRFGDDGRGLDFAAIREKARQFGMGSQADQMDERQLTELIFYPGFSTKTISEISGRGVGMDVVRENVKELQGTIHVETRPGAGTTFVIRIPLTMGVVRALFVKIGGVTYGIPLNDIKDIHRLFKHEINPHEGTCTLAGATVPWHSLPALLGAGEGEDEQRPLVLALTGGERNLAISIPQITGQKEIVLKGLGAHLRTVPGLSGAAVMGDGSIVPVLNIPELIQAAAQRDQAGQMPFKLEIPKAFTVMIVDDSISIRRVMSRLVSGNGWAPVEAKDGLDAIEQLEMEEVRPDCIILDIEMPRMNGFEFLAKLPNIPGGRDIPVIMLTSRTSAKHQEKAFQLGARDFLNKPCKDEEFFEAVLKVTGSTAEGVKRQPSEVLS